MQSTGKKKAQERGDEEYDAEEEESEIGTPKKGQKKEEELDLGLMLDTDIEHYLEPDGKQVEVSLEEI